MNAKLWITWTLRILLVLVAAALLSVAMGGTAPMSCKALAESAVEKQTVLEACSKNMSCRFTPTDVYSMLATAKAADACKP